MVVQYDGETWKSRKKSTQRHNEEIISDTILKIWLRNEEKKENIGRRAISQTVCTNKMLGN